MDYVYIMEVLGNTILTIAIIKMFVYFLKSTDAWIQDGEFPNMVGGIEWKDWTKNLEQMLFNFICLWSFSIFYIVQTTKA